MGVPVPGYEGYYSVSEDGSVYSNYSNRLLKPHKNKNGYLYVALRAPGMNKYKPVHRIVAEAFIPNENNFECVNHKNEDKTDNNVSNLEWCTKAYNNTYNNKTQRCCKRIIQYAPTGEYVKTWSSAREISSAGIANYKNISAVCRGLRNKAGGFIWKFERSANV